jgi:hypothetical protein
MKIVESYPPNFADIKQQFDVERYKPFFCYGDTLYNPYKQVIPIDIQIHEEVHAKQQEEYSNPSFWWTRYLLSDKFRLEQETEAYFYQCKFIKENINDKAYNDCLDECASNLSSELYRINIDFHQARAKIRNYDNVG